MVELCKKPKHFHSCEGRQMTQTETLFTFEEQIVSRVNLE